MQCTAAEYGAVHYCVVRCSAVLCTEYSALPYCEIRGSAVLCTEYSDIEVIPVRCSGIWVGEFPRAGIFMWPGLGPSYGGTALCCNVVVMYCTALMFRLTEV